MCVTPFPTFHLIFFLSCWHSSWTFLVLFHLLVIFEQKRCDEVTVKMLIINSLRRALICSKSYPCGFMRSVTICTQIQKKMCLRKKQHTSNFFTYLNISKNFDCVLGKHHFNYLVRKDQKFTKKQESCHLKLFQVGDEWCSSAFRLHECLRLCSVLHWREVYLQLFLL